VAAGAGAPLPAPAAEGATMLYTSGTTGRPKGALRRPSDPGLTAALLAELGFGDGEVHLVTGPLYHAGPHAFALLAHRRRGTLVVSRRFDAAHWLRLAAEHRVTSAFVAPIPLKQEVIARLGDGFLYEIYGSTELGIATVLRPEDQLRKPGSCGRAYGAVALRVVGDDGTDVPAGEPGELFVRSANAMAGYHGSAEQLASLPGGWQSVGDVAWLDEDGYLHICDRRTDMVITGGMNVYPAEVEAALNAHPDVGDAAVFGVPDDEWGERVHAVVAPRAGVGVDVAALDAFLAGRLAGFKRPRSWSVREELPRTESGKLLKRVLRAEEPAPA
jgi:acyl-CoA synthetase (AMP-forming)/AMP-acid ligase II